MLRFAPSPTGDMDISDLQVALFNHMMSKKLNENLVIRIEDIDKKSNIEGKEKEILEILDLFSIDHTQVIYQSENIKYHSQMAMKLLLDKKAFNCFCSDEALKKDRDEFLKANKPDVYSGFCENLSDEVTIGCEAPFTVRIKKPEHNIEFTDTIKSDCDFSPLEIDSFIILNHDKIPTCEFASAVDDMISNITTVIRSEEHLLSTPKQIHVRESLGYDTKINYIHVPLISNADDDEKTYSIKWLIKEGYLPIAIANYLILLAYDAPKEIFSIEEALEWFDITKIEKIPAKFDIKKLNYINKQHIKDIENMRLSKLVGYADEDIGLLAKIYLEECDTIKQIKEKINLIFSKKESFKKFQKEVKALQVCLKDAPYIDEFSSFEKYIMENTSISEEKLSTPLRIVLTGAIKGPSLSEIYPLIKNYLGEII